MNRLAVGFITGLFLFSCKTHPDSDRHYASDGKIYKLHIDPAIGSSYQYAVSNESQVEMTVDGKEVGENKKTDVTVNYRIGADSTGNYLLRISYEKIHVFTQSGDDKSDFSTENAENPGDPMAKMLESLKSAVIVARVNRAGEVRGVTGFSEVASKVLGEATMISLPDKEKLQQQWRTLVEQGMIKKNVDQLFRMFPDSAVHIGDRWKLDTKENTGISFVVKNTYTLRSITDGKADIESSGEIVSDTTAGMLVGEQVVADLKGTQQGSYLMDIRTGMLVDCKVSAEMEGKVDVMGREIPMKISSGVKMNGKRIQ